ncbi:MAG: bifunctional oligoribonuclease/PAP phosphatase NrnA [Deltaproteobacteria bacterium]|jgi:phosphoesterase RecJ-like protein|nr:bifunctional oligoribonuclease/PAP phosphatase NrnA [Deltaproteobacteria bacterium]
MKQIIQQLKNSRSVLIASHINPDGDALGSLLALGLAMDALHIKAILYTESDIPAVYRFLPEVDRIQNRISRVHAYETAIILDCSNLDRIGRAKDIVTQIPMIINIDHHTTNTQFGERHLIDDTACATAELVFRLLKEMALPISLAMATSIYTGIVTDTGSFRFSNTNASAFEICNQMVQLGVKPIDIARHLYGAYSLGRIKLLNQALESIEISNNGSLSLMTLTQKMLRDTGTQAGDAEGMIQYARRIKDVKIAALIQEQANGRNHAAADKAYHVSLRSDGSIDVAAIASTFGGGGHPSAAGFNIESTVKKIKETIKAIPEIN